MVVVAKSRRPGHAEASPLPSMLPPGLRSVAWVSTPRAAILGLPAASSSVIPVEDQRSQHDQHRASRWPSLAGGPHHSPRKVCAPRSSD